MQLKYNNTEDVTSYWSRKSKSYPDEPQTETQYNVTKVGRWDTYIPKQDQKTSDGFIATDHGYVGIKAPYGYFNKTTRSAKHYKQPDGSTLTKVFDSTVDEGASAMSRSYETTGRTFSYSSRYDRFTTTSRVDAALRTKTMSRLNAKKIDIGVTLAELMETSNYLAGRTTKLLNVLLAIKRGHFTKAIRGLGIKKKSFTTGNLAERWLEANYAIRPILGDVSGAYDLATKGIIDKQDKLSISAKASRKINESYVSGSSTNSGGQYTTKVTGTATCKIYARVSNPSLFAMASYGLTNPALVAWELVPFSFVVDWVLPVGTFLEAWQAPYGLTFETGYDSTYVQEHLNHFYDYDTSAFYGTHKYSYYKNIDRTAIMYDRRKLTGFPTPVLNFDNSLTISNGITTLALLKVLTR